MSRKAETFQTALQITSGPFLPSTQSGRNYVHPYNGSTLESSEHGTVAIMQGCTELLIGAVPRPSQSSVHDQTP